MEGIRRTTAEALEVLDAVLSSIDHSERARLSAPEKVALMSRARRFQDRAASLACVLTDEASMCSLAATGTPITSLIGLQEGRDSGDAAREVFQARDVNKHEAVKQAALAGTLSSRHAAAISKGMAQLPAELSGEQKALAEQAFMKRAPLNNPKRLASLAPQILAEIAPEFVETPDEHHDRLEMQRRRALTKRAFAWGDDGDGSMWFRGLLPHLEAASLITLVQAYVESDRRAAKDRLKATRATGPDPQVMRNQMNHDIDRTPDQRRADALVQMVSNHRGAPTTVGDRPRIVVTIREQDLRDRAEKAGVLPKGAEITAGDLRRLCCDADLVPAVLGGPSEILDVGQTQRLVTPAIRKALTLRDGGCVFPHCTAPDSACEAHHILPWWAGGSTALSNLVLLCPFHHTLVEPDRYNRPADRWVIHIDRETGGAVVTAPNRTDRFRARASGGGPLGNTTLPEPEPEPGTGSDSDSEVVDGDRAPPPTCQRGAGSILRTALFEAAPLIHSSA